MQKNVKKVKEILELTFKKPAKVNETVLKITVPSIDSEEIKVLYRLIFVKECEVTLKRSGTSITIIVAI